jgi:hypothetical protein
VRVPLKGQLKALLGCLAGGFAGGCLIPTVFFIICAIIYNAVGGPGFWFIVVVLGAIAGALLGATVGLFMPDSDKVTENLKAKKRERELHDWQPPETHA